MDRGHKKKTKHKENKGKVAFLTLSYPKVKFLNRYTDNGHKRNLRMSN